jgi:glycosyltransferase involved in cell wall biosynthesis
MYKDIITPSKKFSNELVLIIMSSYNRANSIIKSIESIKNQTYTNVLLHIIDDKSTDNTIEIVSKYIKDNNLNFIKFTQSNTNNGTYHNRNHALFTNKFDYWTICDSDDTINENHIEYCLKNLKSTNKYFCVPKYKRINALTNEILATRNSEGIAFYKHKVFETIGYYDYNRFGADTDYLWRAEKKFGKSLNLNEITYLAYNYGDNLTKIHGSDVRVQYVNKIKNEISKGLIYRNIDKTKHLIL